jgi:hypothetical protein
MRQNLNDISIPLFILSLNMRSGERGTKPPLYVLSVPHGAFATFHFPVSQDLPGAVPHARLKAETMGH